MFENVTEKIKSLAPVVCWGGVGVSVLCGFALLDGGAVILGLVYIFFGSLIAWVASLCLYGFAQLIENSHRIAGHLGNQDGESPDAAGISRDEGNESGNTSV